MNRPQKALVSLLLVVLLAVALWLAAPLLLQGGSEPLRVGYVMPVFTITPYWHSYWNGSSDGCFYSFYAYAGVVVATSSSTVEIKNHLNWLSCRVVTNQVAELPDTYNSTRFIPNLLSILRQNFSTTVIDDIQVHNGGLFSAGTRNFDVLVLSHEEYVTDAEFAQFQRFVATGGRIVATDGNTFYARVNYSSATNMETYVVGHDYSFDGKVAVWSNVRPYAAGETNWFGSVFVKGYVDKSDPFHVPISRYGDEYSIFEIEYARINASGFGRLQGNQVVFNGSYVEHSDSYIGGKRVGPWEVNALTNMTATRVLASYYGLEVLPGSIHASEMLLHPPVSIYCHGYVAGSACSFGLFGEYLLLRGDADARYLLISMINGMGSEVLQTL